MNLYFHYPFCVSKCPYCDFNSYCNLNIDKDLLLQVYIKEMEFYGKNNKKIDAIFFGGGTPSLMEGDFVSKILEKMFTIFDVDSSCEISLEANPNSITLEKMKTYKKAGINRLSIGVQSLRNDDLKLLGRIHNRNEAIEAVEIVQNIFGNRYSIDMIHSRPNQKLSDWEIELKEAVALSPYHVSAYQLIVEKSTPFYKNKIQIPNEDLSLDFLNLTRDILEDNKLQFYEISNYARTGYECRHNMNYWQNGEWIGVGAGAHGRINTDNFVDGYRIRYATENIKNPNKWLNYVLQKGRGYFRKKYLSRKEFIEEFVLMGLRIREGLEVKNMQKNLNENFSVLNIDSLNMLKNNGLLEFDLNCENIKLTREGFMFLNSIIVKLLTKC